MKLTPYSEVPKIYTLLENYCVYAMLLEVVINIECSIRVY